MNLLHKRILIMFSVALNIGFVITAIVMAVDHSGPRQKHSKDIKIIHSLELPEAREQQALESIRRFKTAIEAQELAIRRVRDDIMALLGKNRPLDLRQLHQLYEVANQGEIRKNEIFEAHVIELRNLLGDEKGAQFYSLLLDHLKTKNKSHHR